MTTERNEQFDEMLNECYEPYKIGSLEFLPADVLFRCDPIAYRCEAADFEDGEDE